MKILQVSYAPVDPLDGSPGEPDWVEIMNLGGVDHDIRGAVLTDEKGVEHSHQFGGGGGDCSTVVPSGGFLVVLSRKGSVTEGSLLQRVR
jgi:hypothetical protein